MKFIVAAIVALASATAATAVPAVSISVEAPGVQNTTRTIVSGVETFDGLGQYTSPYATTFGGSQFGGTFDGLLTYGANQYGGAGGTGRYAVVQTSNVLTLNGSGIDYLGLWASSLDGGNSVAFYKGGTFVDSVNLTAYPLADAYKGNPTTPFLGDNGNEKYAFYNIVVTGGFDEVRFVENGGGGFEFDNVTIGSTSATIAAVPEPAVWTLMIAGFGMVGVGMRRRSAATA